MLFMFFLFAVLFMQGVSQYIIDAGPSDTNVGDMQLFFGSLPMTLLSLFMCVAGGLSWWEIARLLLAVSPLYVLVFTFFILVIMLAALNIITGIFVNDAVEMATQDKDYVEQEERQRMGQLVGQLGKLFDKIDTDKTGSINLGEFEAALGDEAVNTTLDALGLDHTDALKIFTVLDLDGSNHLRIEEFVMGILRLKSKLSNVDMQNFMGENMAMLAENNRMVKSLTKMQKRMGERMVDIECELLQLGMEMETAIPGMGEGGETLTTIANEVSLRNSVHGRLVRPVTMAADFCEATEVTGSF